MNLERKIEILSALTDGGKVFPTDRVYLDGGDRILATNGRQLLAFYLSASEQGSQPLVDTPTLLQGADERAKVKLSARDVPDAIRSWLDSESGILADGKRFAVSAVEMLSFLRWSEYLLCPCCQGSGKRAVTDPELYNYDEEAMSFREALERFDRFELQRPARFGEALMDSNLLLSAIAWLPMPDRIDCVTWKEGKGRYPEGRILRLRGDGWTLVHKAMREDLVKECEYFSEKAMEVAT